MPIYLKIVLPVAEKNDGIHVSVLLERFAHIERHAVGIRKNQQFHENSPSFEFNADEVSFFRAAHKL